MPDMPNGFSRFAAVLLLALAIPVQGMAAVAVGQCMAFGHHQDAAGQESHGHAADAADADEHAAHSHDDQDAQHGDEGAKRAHCGPCTACCASASIAGPTGISIRSSPSNVTYFFSQFPPLGFQPNGLDRPPLAL